MEVTARKPSLLEYARFFHMTAAVLIWIDQEVHQTPPRLSEMRFAIAPGDLALGEERIIDRAFFDVDKLRLFDLFIAWLNFDRQT